MPWLDPENRTALGEGRKVYAGQRFFSNRPVLRPAGTAETGDPPAGFAGSGAARRVVAPPRGQGCRAGAYSTVAPDRRPRDWSLYSLGESPSQLRKAREKLLTSAKPSR